MFIGCDKERTYTFVLHETPQTYVLQNEDPMFTMPSVTLYKNGNAMLSQPPISSLAFLGVGKYEIDGNILTVMYEDSPKAIFEISDRGETLTLLSADLSYTKAGSVYKHRSNKDYLEGLTKVDGEKLKFDTLRELAICHGMRAGN